MSKRQIFLLMAIGFVVSCGTVQFIQNHKVEYLTISQTIPVVGKTIAR